MLVSLLLSALVLAIKTDSPAVPGEVIITHASMSTSAIPLWVAQRQNFFGKYGVKSKVVLGPRQPGTDCHSCIGRHPNRLRRRNYRSRRGRGRQRVTDDSQPEQPRKPRPGR